MKQSFKGIWAAAALGWTAITGVMHAQSSSPILGLREVPAGCQAFQNAEIVVKPGTRLTGATLVVRNGMVESVGQGISIPSDAVVYDLKGAAILPGFIDPYSTYGLKKDASRSGRGEGPRYTTSTPGAYHWNEAVRPEFEVSANLDHDAKKAQEWLEAGFTTLHVVPDDGIFRGSSVVLMPGKPTLQEALVKARAATTLSFKKGSSQQSYPESLMGAIALIRQTLIDAAWYAQVKTARQSRPDMKAVETNLSLEALLAYFQEKLPVLFECGDWQDVFRAAKISAEFGQPMVYKAGWDTYKRADALSKLNATLVLSLDFPEPFDLSDPADVREIPFSKLMEWEQAPRGPAILRSKNIPFAITSAGQKKPRQLWENLGRAIRHGLDPYAALEALTVVPAKLLGLEQRFGTLEAGKVANFVVYEENPFRTCEPVVLQTWTAGTLNVFVEIPKLDHRAQYLLSLDGKKIPMLVAGTFISPKARVVMEKDTLKAELGLSGLEIRLSFPSAKGKENSNYVLSGIINGEKMQGRGLGPDGKQIAWTAERTGPMVIDPKEKEKKALEPVDVTKFPALRYPAVAYGWEQQPAQGTWLIRNVTAWTNTADGIQEAVDVLLEEGKIKAVGKWLKAPANATVVDGTGKHLTPGIIDEHSHIAIKQGVNEGSHAVTAEVRIGDVLDSEDINIYRQLSGGVTASQLLHGSANPIGGQAQLIKLRWGALPEEMKFEGAPGFIKFALGENVKQSNWGERFRTRYPQTRMGVEQLFRDSFQAALDYKAKRDASAKKSSNEPPFRRDLQMETVLEIIESKRFVSCHSYVQSEILMLMRVAESFGFRINTFTHILEGYKLASEMKAHGVSASTFSDWWGYKMEVQDAIPHNAAMLHNKGINVCINSDDAEMARRLNQEAAKAVKYGGVPEEDALKMVTLNPAKALRVDQWVGSLEKGKMADVVLWSGNPLSVYSQAEMTFVDGRLYFDRKQDEANRQWIASERERILVKMASAPSKEKRKPGGGDGPQMYHCETLESDYGHE